MPSAESALFRQAHQEMFAAASPIAQFGTAYQAEQAISILLGGVYARAVDGDRRTLLTIFVDDFVKFVQRRRTGEAFAMLAGLSAVAPGVGGDRARKAVQRFTDRDVDGPRWVDEAGNVHPTGAAVVRDEYGDQSQYLVSFEYDSPDPGGPEHVVAAVVDHNRRMVSDVAVVAPAEQVITRWKQVVQDARGHLSIDPVEPEVAAAQVAEHLARTEQVRQAPSQAFLDAWALAVARLARLPEVPASVPPAADDAARNAVVDGFLGSPEAQRVAQEMAQRVDAPMDVVRYTARLAADYAADANSGDPLRWSPTAVRDMLLEWAPRQSGMPTEVSSWLPEVLDAFSQYAHDARQLSSEARAATRMAISGATQQYTSRMTGGSGEAMDVVLQQMIADGVDPSDEAAARRWLTDYLEKQDGRHE